MPIRDILTISDLYGARPSLAVAAELARRFDAHLTGISVALDPLIPAYGVAPASAELIADARRVALGKAREADAAFREAARLAGLRASSEVVEIPTDGYFVELVRRSLLTDLVVIGQENDASPEPMRSAMIEGLLFEGGAPVLVVPYIGVRELRLARACIAWDGSTTAARAVRAGLPLLAASDRVSVLMIGGRQPEEASELAVYLDRHGLRVEIKQIPGTEVPVADALLNTVTDEGYDWVLMGAYGHSRVREYLFGGTTRDILRQMTVPVLMTH